MTKEMRDEAVRERCEHDENRNVVCVLCAVCVMLCVLLWCGMCLLVVSCFVGS